MQKKLARESSLTAAARTLRETANAKRDGTYKPESDTPHEMSS